MASASQWEVVGKPKKAKGTPQTLSKTQKKNFSEKMPRIEPNPPVKEDRTIYSAFLDKEQQQQDRGNAASARPNGNASANNSKKPVTLKKKKESDGKKQQENKVQTLDAAIAEIDRNELETILSQSQMRFPDNQDVWLKDLASFLNMKLERVKVTDPTFKGKSHGYPLEVLPGSCQKVLNSVVKKYAQQTLDHLFYHTINTMLAEAAKDQSTMGYRIFLQLLAQNKPDIALGKVHQYLELLKTHQNRPNHCLSILWAVGQCGNKSFKCGLKVWLDLMLPALEVRQVAHYPVEYLEWLFGQSKSVNNDAYGIVTLREYFQVMDVVFSPKFNLSNDLRKRLVALYPKIMVLAHGDTPSHNLRTFFPSYLSRLNSTQNQVLKTELLHCLVRCLQVDQQSFSVWCQLYTKHLPASGQLLEHIAQNWSKLSGQIDKKLLRETVRSFSVTNEELDGQGRSMEGLDLCQAGTKELQSKLSSSSFPWGFLILFLVSVVSSIVIYDVTSSVSLRASRTVRFLEHYGILALMEQAWGRIHTFFTIVVNWLKANCPVYYAYVAETVGPFLLTCWVSLKEFSLAAEVATRPYRAWIVEETHCMIHCIYDLSPETWKWCGEMAWLSWEVLKDYSLWLWKHCLHLLADLHHWLNEHVLTGSLSAESLQETFRWSLDQAQNYTLSLWGWCNTNILVMVK